MKIYTQEELKATLKSHAEWLRGEACGTRADLTGAVLRDAVLRDAVLRGAVLRGADLTGAVLTGAVLTGAVLRGAVLRGAVLRGAVLRDAVLRDADLRGAVLTGAVLRGAVLTGAVLRGAVLRDADLRGAVLTDAVLRGAVLTGAVLRDADLTGADLTGAVLTDAVLTGAVLRDFEGNDPLMMFAVPSLHRKMLAAIEADGCSLDMATWHRCETTHCRAGWAVQLAGPAGKALEWAIGPAAAGALIHLASCPALDGKVPDFYASNEDALADIRRLAELEPPIEVAQ